jgi:hypothetical protein
MLISNLYAEQAQSFNKKTKEELREILSYEIYIQAVFITDKKDKLYGPTYEMPAGVTVDLVKQINTYFELNKPTGIVTTPVFFIGLIFDLTVSQIKLLTSTIKAWLRFITAKNLIQQIISMLCLVQREKCLKWRGFIKC